MGKYEESLAAVRRALLFRGEQVPFDIEPEAGQLPENFPETFGHVAPHVFSKEHGGPGFAQHPQDVGPEMAFVVSSLSLAGEAKRLAGIAGREEMKASSPRSTVECLEVSVDRSGRKVPFFHSLRQTRSEIGFSLHVARGGIGGADCEVEAQLESSTPGTKSQAMNCILPAHAAFTAKTSTRATSAPVSGSA